MTQPPIPTRAQLATAFLALLGLWFVLCRHLSGEWSVNEQYSYGWFVPFFALFLFWLRWEDRPKGGRRKFATANPSFGGAEGGGRKLGIAVAIGMAALLLLFPIRLFEIANPDWRPLGWLHTGVVVTMTLLVLWSAGGKALMRHFAFPVAFFFVAVPWVSPIEAPIVQGLMRIVAAVVTESITLFGIPAQLEGSLIRVSTGLVGVNEACSGVRSLQTSIMIGLLFGELKRLSVTRRILLVGGALAIAIIANFGRAFFLVWVAATQSIDAVDRWHDFAGYTIVAVVFCGSLALTAIFNRNKKVGRKKEEVGNENDSADLRPRTSDLPPRFLLPPSYFLLCFLWLLAVEIGVEIWYRTHERELVSRIQWTVRWPETAPAFREIRISEEVKSTLRFDEGREVAWKIPDLAAGTDSRTSGRGEQPNCFLFFFRWQPGNSTILRARAHRPDICLPNVGWRAQGDHGMRIYRATDNLALPFRHFSFVRDAIAGQRPVFAHAFFCMREDKVSASSGTARDFDLSEKAPTDWMASDRWRVVRQGLRNPGQQVIEFVVMTPLETTADKAEAKFAALVPEIVKEK